MLPIDELNVPLTCNVEPSNCKSGLVVPPSLNVPSFKLNSEPAVVLKLLDFILPVVIVSPDINVEPFPAGFKYNALTSVAVRVLL